MNQLAIDFGSKLRDAGMQRAMEHAEAECPAWGEVAYGYLRAFLLRRPGPFQGEDVRKFASEHGCPSAPSQRAWGSVIARAAKANLIRRVGYAPVDNPAAHRTPAAVWSAA